MRYTRSALGGLASSGYIDMAMSCGMTRRQAVLRVGLRLAMPQLVSVIGLTFAEMVTGVMVIENLFALPGIGNGLVTTVPGFLVSTAMGMIVSRAASDSNLGDDLAKQLTARPDVPFRVVISESVALARRSGATDGHKFVNAVLDRAARELRPQEH